MSSIFSTNIGVGVTEIFRNNLIYEWPQLAHSSQLNLAGFYGVDLIKPIFGNFMPFFASILCQVILHLRRCSSVKAYVLMSTYTSNNIGCYR